MDDKRKFNGFGDDIELEDFEDVEEETDDKVEEETSEEEHHSEDETETTEVKSEEEEVETEDEVEETQSERNAKFAEKRRAKEAREREAREAKIKEAAKLEAELGIIKENPFTNKPIKDEEDLKIYKLMKEIDEEGGDPVNDLPELIAKKNREESARKSAEDKEREEKTQKTNQEAAELAKAYPSLNLSELANDNEYLELCAQKGGRWTMLECYEHLVAKREKEASSKKNEEDKKVVKENGKKITTVPSSTKGGKKTSDNYLEMTDEEYLAIQKNNADFF